MKKILVLFLTLILCLFSIAGCSTQNKADSSFAPLLTTSPDSRSITSEQKNNIFIIDSNGKKKYLSENERAMLENTASILAQQILTFTDVANTEKSVYPQDFDTADISNICISGGGFSGIGSGCGGFEYDEFYPYKEMALHQGPYFAMSRENCRKIAKQLFGRDDFIIEDDYLKFDITTGHYWDLANRKTPYSVSGAVWADGVVSVDFTVKLRKGDRIKYRTDFVPVEEDGSLYLQLKEIHKGIVVASFSADDYIKNLRPQLDYTIVSCSVYGEEFDEMAFSCSCIYYENRGESGELSSFDELVRGAEDYYTNDNTYRRARNMHYLVENANIVYAKDARTPDSTGYENIPRDNVLVATTYENTVPVQVRYTNYFKSDRKPKQLWIDYFTQVRDKTPGAKDTAVVIYESYEFTIDGVECALVHCTNFVPESVYDGPVLDGPPPGSEFLYYNDFHYFIGDKKEKAERGFVWEGTVDTKPLTECTTSFCGDAIPCDGYQLEPIDLYCSFYDKQGNAAVYRIYDMMWTGDCSINMCRERDKQAAVIDIDGDGQVEIVEWMYAHSFDLWNFPTVYNLDKSTETLVNKGLNIEW